MKKIKSVKLINNYLVKRNTGNWSYQFCDYPVFSEYTIRNNPEKFEIEYEGRKKFIDLRVEYPVNMAIDERHIQSLIQSPGLNYINIKVIKLQEGNL